MSILFNKLLERTLFGENGAVFSYLRDFIWDIIEELPSPIWNKLYLDRRVGMYVLRYLRMNYKSISTSPRVILSEAVTIQQGTNVSMEDLPFRKDTGNVVFYRGKEVILTTSSDSSALTIYYLRGTVNQRDLVSKAYLSYTNYLTDSFKVDGRWNSFCVQHIMGGQGTSNPPVNNNHPLEALETPPDWAGLGNQPKLKNKHSSGWGGGGMISKVDSDIDDPLVHSERIVRNQERIDPFGTLFYGEEVLNCIDQILTWSRKEHWFKERGIPWRRGVLLYGPGGTGKSSFAKSVAQKLGLPVYQYFLSTLSDKEFLNHWNNMPTPCMALFEDFDSVFHLRENITAHKSLSFDCVLNAISGVSTKDGILLVVTTNRPELVDPAMGVDTSSSVSTRPGRLDMAVRIGEMDEYNRRKMASNILRDWPVAIEEAVARGEGYVPAQFQELCIQTAFELIVKDEEKKQ